MLFRLLLFCVVRRVLVEQLENFDGEVGGRYLVQNLDWLQDLLSEYSDEDYFVFDCPGTLYICCSGGGLVVRWC